MENFLLCSGFLIGYVIKINNVIDLRKKKYSYEIYRNYRY